MKAGIEKPPSNSGATSAVDKSKNIAANDGDTEKDITMLTLEDIRQQIRYIEKAISNKELNFMARVVRSIPAIRKKLTHEVLSGLVQAGKLNTSLIPEVEVYLHLLLLIYLIDKRRHEEATRCSDLLMDRIGANNKRTMSLLASRCYFYHSRSYELVGRLNTVRPFFHSRLCTATLHGNADSKAVLINLLLRNYLHYDLFDQASKLALRVDFPTDASNNECARYSYYVGRIKAIQLDYADAHRCLVSALRKAPQRCAVAFKQALHKFNTVVELLLGQQPDRAMFRQSDFQAALHPYFQLTQATHAGDVSRFMEVLRTYTTQFASDGTYTLIQRLHHNVLKTAIKRISLSYSRISLPDIAERLQLNSAEDAEYMVAKAIHDGVIDATIDHEKGYVKTNDTLDVYTTREPFDQYDSRIEFCLNVRNQAVRAMRYPPKQYDKDMESAEERREREQQEMESVKEMTEDDPDGFP